ncbi:hypothetical protein ANOM_004618 [Aspergillus nomiae NRRL 13137]|uniref:Zn(2)-C6 fungal-type domain-containing protein n=1 Tax=Aspergillus nomiae NRRL (strain ATCC 15546 / NRRL 13137 / CBS 260.88 / M93) TaxID=1509407 RepID=A0A0L1J7R8_ASPN3|nr:uncharacterized protein ANOM_004618 [Aspergillus nomiae NRRL 13137]KNG87799.1 hypothetical protein ANOM_004618 [Aspergillus nomiae NRRL 13137]
MDEPHATKTNDTPPSTPANLNRGRNVQGRVSRACDTCRLKKAKCNGAQPCSRCEDHDAICIFGERKTSLKKCPPEYVEMLEQQQDWLTKGLREMYRRAIEGKGWPGEPLGQKADGHPLTHDILFRLGVLNKEEKPDIIHPPDIFDNVDTVENVDISYSVQTPVHVPSEFLYGECLYQVPPSFSLPQLADNSRQTPCLSSSYFGSTELGIPQLQPSSGHVSTSAFFSPTHRLSILDGISFGSPDDDYRYPVDELASFCEVDLARST